MRRVDSEEFSTIQGKANQNAVNQGVRLYYIPTTTDDGGRNDVLTALRVQKNVYRVYLYTLYYIAVVSERFEITGHPATTTVRPDPTGDK